MSAPAGQYADQRAHDVALMTAAERAALDASASRFAVRESAHAWQWTYSNITAAEAQHIADQLSAGSGETWTVTEISEQAGDQQQ